MSFTAKGILFSEYGSPEVLKLQQIEVSAPLEGEVQIRQCAIGLNFIDIYHRKGVFGAQLSLPSGLGVEGVGEVIAVGSEVASFAVGDRIAYVGGPPGGYATHRNLPAARALKLPGNLDDQTIAALAFKGLTAEYLVHRCVNLNAGATALVHAAAGGVGSLVCQWLKSSGIRVIGTVSSREKEAIAIQNGCSDVILYLQDDFVAKVRDFTEGKGVEVVYDSVGADTTLKSLDCLAPRGTLVSFGASSGPAPHVDISLLGSSGSLFVTRPSIAHYTADREELETAALSLFSAIADGTLKAPRITSYPLEDAAQAHADLEARRTIGSVVLIP